MKFSVLKLPNLIALYKHTYYKYWPFWVIFYFEWIKSIGTPKTVVFGMVNYDYLDRIWYSNLTSC